MIKLKNILQVLLVCSLTLGLLTILEARRGRGGGRGSSRRGGRGSGRVGRSYRSRRYSGHRYRARPYRRYCGSYIGPTYYEPWPYYWGYDRWSYPWAYGYDWPWGYGFGINVHTGGRGYERELHEFREIYRAADFDDVLNRNIFVIAKFYDDNAASRSMAEIDSYIMKKFSDKVRFIQVNVNKNKDLFEKILGEQGQLTTPSYVFFINGKPYTIKKGIIEKRPFKLLVREILKKDK